MSFETQLTGVAMFGKPGTRTRKAIRGLTELDRNGVIFDLSQEEVARELQYHRWIASEKTRGNAPGRR